MVSLHTLLGDLTGWSLFLPLLESDPQSWSEESSTSPQLPSRSGISQVIIRFNIELSYEYIENGIIRFNKLIKYDHNIELSDYPMREIPSILKMGWSYEYIELSYEYIENMGLSDWLKTDKIWS